MTDDEQAIPTDADPEVLADEAGEGVEVGVGGGVHQPVSRMRMASASRV